MNSHIVKTVYPFQSSKLFSTVYCVTHEWQEFWGITELEGNSIETHQVICGREDWFVFHYYYDYDYKNSENKLNIISVKHFSNNKLWWVICKYNIYTCEDLNRNLNHCVYKIDTYVCIHIL